MSVCISLHFFISKQISMIPFLSRRGYLIFTFGSQYSKYESAKSKIKIFLDNNKTPKNNNRIIRQ